MMYQETCADLCRGIQALRCTLAVDHEGVHRNGVMLWANKHQRGRKKPVPEALQGMLGGVFVQVEKRCPRCHETKPIQTGWHGNANRLWRGKRDGLQDWCNDCMREQAQIVALERRRAEEQD